MTLLLLDCKKTFPDNDDQYNACLHGCTGILPSKTKQIEKEEVETKKDETLNLNLIEQLNEEKNPIKFVNGKGPIVIVKTYDENGKLESISENGKKIETASTEDKKTENVEKVDMDSRMGNLFSLLNSLITRGEPNLKVDIKTNESQDELIPLIKIDQDSKTSDEVSSLFTKNLFKTT